MRARIGWVVALVLLAALCVGPTHAQVPRGTPFQCTAVVSNMATPIILPVNVDVCWINSTAGSKFLVLTGYYAP
jgi:hypothetical protein